MTWTEVNPGHFQRLIGENERFIKAIGDGGHAVKREHWSVTVSAKFTLPDTPSRLMGGDIQWLRQVWKALRFQHPSIASTANKETLDYFVPSAKCLEDWASETFNVLEDTTQDAGDVIAALKPSRYVTSYYLPVKSQFIIHLAHWRTDGYGALQLLNAFFESCRTVTHTAVDDLPWGTEVIRLVPSVEEALHNPMESTPEIHAAANKYLSTMNLIQNSVGLSQTTDICIPPMGTRSTRLPLSKGLTERLSEACRAQGISLTAAVHASVTAVTYEFAHANSKNKPYTSTMRFSLRPFLPKPYDNSSVAAGIYTGGYMFQVQASQSWLDNAREYHHQYLTGVTKDFLISRRQYARNAFANMDPPRPGTLPSVVDISSIDITGLVEPCYSIGDHHIHVAEISVGVETLTRQVYCFMWIFRGCLELSIAFNEAFYDRLFMQQVVETVSQVLQKELGVVV